MNIVRKGQAEMKYDIEKKRKTNKDMDYNNLSRRFRRFKCDSLAALQTESREE